MGEVKEGDEQKRYLFPVEPDVPFEQSFYGRNKPHIKIEGNGVEFYSNGVEFDAKPSSERITMTIDGQQQLIQRGEMAAEIHFSASGMTDYVGEYEEAAALLQLMWGVSDMVDTFVSLREQGQGHLVPDKIYGKPKNRRLGNLASKVGFRLSDESTQGAANDINKTDPVEVFAYTDDIIEATHTMQQKGLNQRLERMAKSQYEQRQQAVAKEKKSGGLKSFLENFGKNR